MLQTVKDELNLRNILFILNYSIGGDVTKTCHEFEIPRLLFYNWRKKFNKGGREGLVRKKPIPLSHPIQLPQTIVDKISVMALPTTRPRQMMAIPQIALTLFSR